VVPGSANQERELQSFAVLGGSELTTIANSIFKVFQLSFPAPWVRDPPSHGIKGATAIAKGAGSPPHGPRNFANFDKLWGHHHFQSFQSFASGQMGR
jgi:hypothetical protein